MWKIIHPGLFRMNYSDCPQWQELRALEFRDLVQLTDFFYLISVVKGL